MYPVDFPRRPNFSSLLVHFDDSDAENLSRRKQMFCVLSFLLLQDGQRASRESVLDGIGINPSRSKTLQQALARTELLEMSQNEWRIKEAQALVWRAEEIPCTNYHQDLETLAIICADIRRRRRAAEERMESSSSDDEEDEEEEIIRPVHPVQPPQQQPIATQSVIKKQSLPENTLKRDYNKMMTIPETEILKEKLFELECTFNNTVMVKESFSKIEEMGLSGEADSLVKELMSVRRKTLQEPQAKMMSVIGEMVETVSKYTDMEKNTIFTTCPICLSCIVSPSTFVGCGHVFCEEDIKALPIVKYGGSKKSTLRECPSCRTASRTIKLFI
jgi:hypothetical protein